MQHRKLICRIFERRYSLFWRTWRLGLSFTRSFTIFTTTLWGSFDSREWSLCGPVVPGDLFSGNWRLLDLLTRDWWESGDIWLVLALWCCREALLRLKGLGVGDRPCRSSLLDEEEDDEEDELNICFPDSEDPGDLLSPCWLLWILLDITLHFIFD